MAQEVLLMADVPDLGSIGSVVRVADGFARNYLIPRKLAEPMSDVAMRRLEKVRREQVEARRLQIEEARRLAAQIGKVSCTLRARTADGARLYGSVGAAEIIEAFEALNIHLDRRQLVLDAPIKELGVFELPIRLHPEVEVTTKIWVVEE